MAIEQQPLPYDLDALEPHMCRETMEYHYGKHHAGYVKKINKAIENDESLQGKTLEELVCTTSGSDFNNAAQAWNHDFFWQCLRPASQQADPPAKLAEALKQAFGSLEDFKSEFAASAKSNFGSGWTWLIQPQAGDLRILNTSDADTPLRDSDMRPLLTLDVWEHAYYLDHRNSRGDYIEAFWKLVNWEFAAQQMRD